MSSRSRILIVLLACGCLLPGLVTAAEEPLLEGAATQFAEFAPLGTGWELVPDSG